MWTRIIDWLCCPLCSHFLELTPFEDSLKPVSANSSAVAETRGIAEASLRHWTEAGLLLCHACRVCFPIWHGLPVLLPYSTQSHQEFSVDFGHRLSGMLFSARFGGCGIPKCSPITSGALCTPRAIVSPRSSPTGMKRGKWTAGFETPALIRWKWLIGA